MQSPEKQRNNTKWESTRVRNLTGLIFRSESLVAPGVGVGLGGYSKRENPTKEFKMKKI